VGKEGYRGDDVEKRGERGGQRRGFKKKGLLQERMIVPTTEKRKSKPEGGRP